MDILDDMGVSKLSASFFLKSELRHPCASLLFYSPMMHLIEQNWQ